MRSLLSVIVILSFFYGVLNHSVQAAELILPETSDWENSGIAINEGNEGDWDRFLWGAFANSLIKRNGTYFLYYQGSPYYDDTCESVAERAIGVATSTDGINWTKYSGNPIITWSDEEVLRKVQ